MGVNESAPPSRAGFRAPGAENRRSGDTRSLVGNNLAVLRDVSGKKFHERRERSSLGSKGKSLGETAAANPSRSMRLGSDTQSDR